MKSILSETWFALFLLIVLVILPLFVGIAVMKIFRYFRPLKKSAPQSLIDIGKKEGDPFVFSVIAGWGICAPFYYFLYDTVGAYIILN